MAGDKHEGHPQYRELGAYTAPAAPVQGEEIRDALIAAAEEIKACYQRIDELETALKEIAWMDDFLSADSAKAMMNIAREVLLEPFPAESGA